MPKTPQVNFNFRNENVQVSVPQNGISHVVARTTKGPFNDPSTLITSFTQFQRIFGEEIVPDGTISNIKKALELGSKLRVSRVAGATPSYGYAVDGGTPSTPKVFSLTLTNADDEEDSITLSFKIRSKEQGTKFEDMYMYDNIYLKFSIITSGPKTAIALSQYTVSTVTSATKPLYTHTLLSWNDSNNILDFRSLKDFVELVPNLDIEVTAFTPNNSLDIAGVIAWLSQHTNYIPDTAFVTTTVFTLPKGNDGGDSTETTWYNAFEATLDYNDAYNVILSHIHQHLPDDYTEVYLAVSNAVNANKECKLMVELPKLEASDTLTTYLTKLSNMVSIVGQGKFTCYFGGGIKYYDDLGVIRENDVLGSVIGLHDSCASVYGPWYSPAGIQRGIIYNALGPVMPNLGTPSKVDTLQQFADWYMNLFVIKDTPAAGKRTMLWHNFTSSPINDSEKFISIVNLNLYLKKNIRPILESHLEDPNTFSTWKIIYDQVKPILDELVNRNALTNPQWFGDQDAKTYEDLQINNEADVRAGKYKVVLSYKDIVTMQDVTIDIVIAKSEQSISINI